MTTSRRKLCFVVVVALQLAALGAMIAKRVHLLRTGVTAHLECVPIDPRSLLSGDYVRLNFRISRFSASDLARLNLWKETFREHETVFVALERGVGETFHRAAAVAHDRARLEARWPLVLRGTVRNSWSGALEIRYGVEQYFVPQHQGLRIEQNLSRTSVELAVAPSGESALRRLLIDGRDVQFY